MSAIGGSDEHSQTAQHPETSEQYNSAESGFDYDPNYEPEREFVLMPLFRRIGEMLGLRRNQEPEYIYEPEQSTAVHQTAVRRIEPQEEVVLPETAIQYSEPQMPAENPAPIESAPEFAQQHREHRTEESIEEAPLRGEWDARQGVPEPALQQSSSEPHEVAARPIYQKPQQDLSPIESIGNEAAQEPLVSARSEAPEMEPAHAEQEEWPTPPLPATLVSPEPSRKRNPEEIRQLVAPLREAAVKITAIVAQAAEWLRAKEEEFLRSAEVTDAKPKARPETSSISELHSRPENLIGENTSLQSDTPTLHQAQPPIMEREVRPAPIQFVAKPDRPMARTSVPFWKRINWAEEFTPKRVAVLGGVAMAVLLVVGISLARRPASSALPEQQTRSIEPGGVTVSTHPVAVPVPPQVLRKASASDRRSPIPQQHRSRRTSAAAYDDEPEVVIHHYETAKKPSPVKQTTVAGVRHYSDM